MRRSAPDATEGQPARADDGSSEKAKKQTARAQKERRRLLRAHWRLSRAVLGEDAVTPDAEDFEIDDAVQDHLRHRGLI